MGLHPLTKPLHGGQKGSSIQVIDLSLEDVRIQAIRQWCALHKTDTHSDSNCWAQQEFAPPDAAKRRPAGAKKPSKPRRLCFKSSNDKKKFLRSIEEMEGVSFDKSSDEDDNEVFEQSLMQLDADSSSESSDNNENHSDLHLFVLQPGNMLEEADVIMTEVDAPRAQVEEPLAPPNNDLNGASSAVLHLSIDTSSRVRIRYAQAATCQEDWPQLVYPIKVLFQDSVQT